MRVSIFVVLLSLFVAGVSGASAQDSEPALQALRMNADDAVDMDGLLSEGAWARAVPIDDFRQVEPLEGGDPTERTEIRVLYDDDALYIGAMIFDHPDSILAFQKRRDAGLGTDDRFMWILDTFSDGRTGYFFEMNAAGLMGDGLIGGGGGGFGVNKSWDGIWEGRTAILADGWSVEIRIPFATINFNPAADSWGINFQRTIRRRNEEQRWRGWRRSESLFQPVYAGRVVGFEGLSQGVGLEVTPYAVQSWRTVPGDTVGGADPTSYPGDVGVDVGYSVTPSLRAAISVNTDFAEVEVDQRRVNLTRFPDRFPEQRDFFLEGSGVYSFASRSGPSPYFSRRIGLQNGRPVPIEYAARLGGQAGRYELGFQQVATGREENIAPENFSIARVKRSLFEQSSVGVVYTRRATDANEEDFSPEDRHTAGVDLDLSTRTFLGDKNLEMEAFAVWNSNPEPDVDRSTQDLGAWGFRFNYPNDIWEAHLSYREFGNAYDPAVGFVPRNDFRRVEPRVAWGPRPSLAWIRSLQFSAQFRYMEGLTFGDVQEREWDFGLLQVNFESGDFFSLSTTRTYEGLDNGFTVGGDIPILPGEYSNWNTSLRFRSAGRRQISVNGELSRGGFWDGSRQRYQAELTFRPVPGISVSGDYELNSVQLPRGDFDTNLFRLNGGWDVSPWASMSTSLQYDDQSEIMGLFALGRWIVKPGNELFVVYTHNWQRTVGDPLGDPRGESFTTLTKGGAVKVTYTLRW